MSSSEERKKDRRSQAWFGEEDLILGFIHRAWMKNQGTPHRMFDGRPVIGICNTWSEMTPCNAHLRAIAERVKFGVYEAGGFPVEFPVMSIGESHIRPAGMLFRNLASMDVEESIRGNPMDGVVLLCGCDKTTPSLLMGAASNDLPTIVVSGGPMLSGRFRGEVVGSGTSIFSMVNEVIDGSRPIEDMAEAESCMSRSAGHCNTMGTASSMGSAVEALGMGLPTNAVTPAVDARRYTLAQDAGTRIVEMVEEDLRMSKILTREAFENAIRINAAVGGSTNVIIHLLALAGRIEVPLALEDFDPVAAGIPLLVDVMPSGRFLTEDFFEAGGLPVVMKELGDLLHTDAITVTGKTVAENVAGAECWNREVIRPLDNPVKENAATAVLKGNLAPDGAVIKVSAASPSLMKHRGKAVVFESNDELRDRLEDPALELDENSVLVLRNVGPRGYPGMPEVGKMVLPKQLLEKGITDVVQISDARMSGTAYGTVVLHVTPEAAVGGPLALVKSGDEIELDVEARSLHLYVSEEELAERRSRWKPKPPPKSGYQRLYVEHVMQANEGADFDFLQGCRGPDAPALPFATTPTPYTDGKKSED
jgi:dihydroxy-acid dehydratase